MRGLVSLVLVGLVLALAGCGATARVQLPDKPTPPPGHGPQSATMPGKAGQRLLE